VHQARVDAVSGTHAAILDTRKTAHGLRNAIEVALIVAQAARHNRQSQGCPYREDSVSVEGNRLI